MLPKDIEQAAKERFPTQEIKIRQTPDGFELLVGPEYQECYSAEEHDDGSIHFERRD